LNKHIPELKKAANNEKLALKEKVAAKHRLKKAELERSKARKKLFVLGSLISAPTIGAGAYQGLSKATKLLSQD